LALNPVLQCVEWIRESYYWDYRSEVLDRAYVLELATIMIAMALLIERLMRGRVLQG
jgi:capsular polysaccharide transport system permease protein